MTAHPSLTAIVLAGSRGPEDPVARAAGETHKAFVPVCGEPMLKRVVETLQVSPHIGEIVVCLDPSAMQSTRSALLELKEMGVRFLEAEATPSLTVVKALEHIGGPPAFVTTGDHPLLTPAMIDEFLTAAGDGCDVAFALVGASLFKPAFPGVRRTYLKFSDDHYSGCNMFLLATPVSVRAVRFWRRVEQDRKKPWRVVRAFGLGNLILFLLGRLELDTAIKRASKKIGAAAKAVRLTLPEAAIDVDRPEDLTLAETILERRGAKP